MLDPPRPARGTPKAGTAIKDQVVSCTEGYELHEKYIKALTAYVSHQDELRLPRVRDWAVEKSG